MLGLGQFPAGRAGWEPQPMGTVMDGVAYSGTFHGLSHRLRLALASRFLCRYSAAFSWELGNVMEDTGAPLGPQAAMGPGNFLEGGNREVAKTGMGWGRSQASLTLLLPRDHLRLCQLRAPWNGIWVLLSPSSLFIQVPQGVLKPLPGPICSF